MKYIPHPNKKDNFSKILLGNQIREPWPKAKIFREVEYETCDGKGTMIFEPGDEIEIVGRYFADYIMLVTNHKGNKEELLININNVELI